MVKLVEIAWKLLCFSDGDCQYGNSNSLVSELAIVSRGPLASRTLHVDLKLGMKFDCGPSVQLAPNQAGFLLKNDGTWILENTCATKHFESAEL